MDNCLTKLWLFVEQGWIKNSRKLLQKMKMLPTRSILICRYLVFFLILNPPNHLTQSLLESLSLKNSWHPETCWTWSTFFCFCFQSQKKGLNPQFLQSRNLKCIALCEGTRLTKIFTTVCNLYDVNNHFYFIYIYNSYYIFRPAQAWGHLGSSKYRSCLHTVFLCVSTFMSISAHIDCVQGSQNRQPDIPGLLCFLVGLPKCITTLPDKLMTSPNG